MERVFSVDDIPWADLKGLPGARGVEFQVISFSPTKGQHGMGVLHSAHLVLIYEAKTV